MIGHVDIDSGMRQTESSGVFSLPIPSFVVVSMQVCHARDLGSSPDRVKHKSYPTQLNSTLNRVLLICNICIKILYVEGFEAFHINHVPFND